MFPLPAFEAARPLTPAVRRPALDPEDPELRSVPIVVLALAVALASRRDRSDLLCRDGARAQCQ